MTELLAGLDDVLTFQRYDPPPAITGVRLRPLAKHRGSNGWFMEWLRLTGGEVDAASPSFTARQLNVTYAEPQRINAFHIHPKHAQAEIWTVIAGQLLVWLIDCRAESPTAGARRPVILSGEAPVHLFIPAGVAHGYQAGAGGATLLYAATEQFDRDDPDEGRLPWDLWGAELWQPDRG